MDVNGSRRGSRVGYRGGKLRQRSTEGTTDDHRYRGDGNVERTRICRIAERPGPLYRCAGDAVLCGVSVVISFPPTHSAYVNLTHHAA